MKNYCLTIVIFIFTTFVRYSLFIMTDHVKYRIWWLIVLRYPYISGECVTKYDTIKLYEMKDHVLKNTIYLNFTDEEYEAAIKEFQSSIKITPNLVDETIKSSYISHFNPEECIFISSENDDITVHARDEAYKYRSYWLSEYDLYFRRYRITCELRIFGIVYGLGLITRKDKMDNMIKRFRLKYSIYKYDEKIRYIKSSEEKIRIYKEIIYNDEDFLYEKRVYDIIFNKLLSCTLSKLVSDEYLNNKELDREFGNILQFIYPKSKECFLDEIKSTSVHNELMVCIRKHISKYNNTLPILLKLNNANIEESIAIYKSQYNSSKKILAHPDKQLFIDHLINMEDCSYKLINKISIIDLTYKLFNLSTNFSDSYSYNIEDKWKTLCLIHRKLENYVNEMPNGTIYDEIYFKNILNIYIDILYKFNSELHNKSISAEEKVLSHPYIVEYTNKKEIKIYITKCYINMLKKYSFIHNKSEFERIANFLIFKYNHEPVINLSLNINTILPIYFKILDSIQENNLNTYRSKIDFLYFYIYHIESVKFIDKELVKDILIQLLIDKDNCSSRIYSDTILKSEILLRLKTLNTIPPSDILVYSNVIYDKAVAYLKESHLNYLPEYIMMEIINAYFNRGMMKLYETNKFNDAFLISLFNSSKIKEDIGDKFMHIQYIRCEFDTLANDRIINNYTEIKNLILYIHELFHPNHDNCTFVKLSEHELKNLRQLLDKLGILSI